MDFYNRRKTPLYLVPELQKVKFSGGTIKDYGGPGLTNVELGSICYEFARNDASIGTFCGVHTLLGTPTIHFLGDEE
jgi:glutaryl-CoA dehydrogenase